MPTIQMFENELILPKDSDAILSTMHIHGASKDCAMYGEVPFQIEHNANGIIIRPLGDFDCYIVMYETVSANKQVITSIPDTKQTKKERRKNKIQKWKSMGTHCKHNLWPKK